MVRAKRYICFVLTINTVLDHIRYKISTGEFSLELNFTETDAILVIFSVSSDSIRFFEIDLINVRRTW